MNVNNILKEKYYTIILKSWITENILEITIILWNVHQLNSKLRSKASTMVE